MILVMRFSGLKDRISWTLVGSSFRELRLFQTRENAAVVISVI